MKPALRWFAICFAAVLAAPEAATARGFTPGSGAAAGIAKLLAAAPADDLAEDELSRQISRWSWPKPRIPKRLRKGAPAPLPVLDGRSQAYLHLGPGGAAFPLDPRDARLTEAARRVGRFAPVRALPSLRLALRSGDPAVRAQAALALGWARDPGAAPFVVALLGDREPAVRARAAEALGVMDDRAALAKLQAALTDPSPAVRRAGAIALGKLGDVRAIAPLRAEAERRGLDASDAAFRRAAWEAIAGLGGRSAVSVLRSALGDPAVRYGAIADNLGRAALPAELRELADRGADEDAVRSLAAAAGIGADGIGLDLLGQDLRDPDPVLRRAAVVALAAARNPLSTDGLLKALSDPDGQVRGLAAHALARVGNPRSVAPLAEALGRGDMRIAGLDQAGPALVYLADPRALPALRRAVRSLNPVVAADALSALGQLGGAAETPLVEWALAQPKPEVRAAAARAVADLAEVDAAKERFVACGSWGKPGVLTDADMVAGRPRPVPAPSSGCGLRTLLGRLADSDGHVRLAAGQALGSLGDERAYGALFDATRDGDRAVADAARIAIGQIGVAHATDPLGRQSQRGSLAAAKGLAAMGHEWAAMRMASLLSAQDSATRGRAAEALRHFWDFGGGGLGGAADAQAASHLGRALHDRDRAVRIQAALALAEFPGGLASSALRSAMAQANPSTRAWFAAALLAQGATVGGRTSAADAAAWDALDSAAASPDPEFRRSAAEALEWLDQPEGAWLAARLTTDRDAAVRLAGAKALVHAPGEDGDKLLAQLVSEGRAAESVAALDAIGGRDYRAQDLVDSAREHRDTRVRWAAERLVLRASRFGIVIVR
jgi:HEAT repeat protein